MANGDNENQGNMDRGKTEEYLKEQKDIMTRLQQGEEANRDELINALDEMKKTEGQEDQELATYLNQAMQQLKAFPETLAPEMYRDVLGDVIDEMGDRQAGIFQNLLSEVGGLNDAMKSGFDRMSGVLGDAFSPLMELKEFGVGAFEMLKGGFEKITGIFGSVFGGREEEKQTSILGSIKNYMSGLLSTQKEQQELQERQYKASLRKDKTGEEGGMDVGWLEFAGIIGSGILAGVTGLASAISGDIRNMYRPFINVIKGIFTRITGVFRGILGRGGRLSNLFSYIRTGFQKVVNLLNVARGYIDDAIRYGGRLSSVVGGIGRVLGKLVFPLMATYQIIRGMISGDTIRDKILQASAGVLSLVTQIPEWIVNGILSLFTDFRVDFGREAIANAVNRITDWVFQYVTVPVMNFITKTLPNILSSIGNFFTTTIPNFFTTTIPQQMSKLVNQIGQWLGNVIPSFEDIKGMLPSPGDIASKVGSALKFWESGEEKKPPRPGEKKEQDEGGFWSNIPGFKTGGAVREKGIYRLHAGEYVLPKSAVDRMGGFNDVERLARTRDQAENERRNREAQERARGQRELVARLDNIDANTRQRPEPETRESTPKVESEPPDEIESLALLLFNKSWGVT